MASWQRIAERAEAEVVELRADLKAFQLSNNIRGRKIDEHKSLLKDLLRCGDFYSSAIEIDKYIDNPIDGEEFKKRIKQILRQ